MRHNEVYKTRSIYFRHYCASPLRHVKNRCKLADNTESCSSRKRHLVPQFLCLKGPEKELN
uniref:Uncharacterized protein n=1 Tax=Anguilla anguilla TaxID=7936 RepID=A0A0E9WUY3_ANGAN